MPDEFVWLVLLTPVAVFVSVIEAFATAALDESFTVPVTMPRPVWAKSEMDASATTAAKFLTCRKKVVIPNSQTEMRLRLSENGKVCQSNLEHPNAAAIFVR